MQLIYPLEFKIRDKTITNKWVITFGGVSGNLYYWETKKDFKDAKDDNEKVISSPNDSTRIPGHGKFYYFHNGKNIAYGKRNRSF